MIDPTAHIAKTAIIGNPFRPLLDDRKVKMKGDTTIGAGVWIGQYASIGQGVTISANSIIEDFVEVQHGTFIGSRALLSGRCWVGIEVRVGDHTVIRGHVGDGAQIGANCRIAGDLIHRQLDPSLPWDDPAAEEPAAVVEDDVFVGWRAVIVGEVNIGAGAYVCAGALITRDVPPGYIAFNHNQISHPRDWPGTLGKSAFFRRPTVRR